MTPRPTSPPGHFAAAIHSDTQAAVFGGCLLVLALHATDTALAHPTRSDAARLGLLVATIALVPALWRVFIARGRAVRACIAGALGLIATAVALAIDVPHAALAGAGGGDYTGLACGLGGVVLIGLAFRISLRGRPIALQLVAGLLTAFVVAEWLVAPALNAGLATHAPRPRIADASTIGIPGARDVSFRARDGVRLAGWYVPGTGGAAIVLLHGSHDSRVQTLRHLRMLSAAGYAVLAYDARGHGRSAGQTNALGWRGTDDIAGAVSFLGRQAGVNPDRIAALGLSMGAEEALRAAAGGLPLRAVVADGAGASTLGDSRLVESGIGPVFVSVTWLTMRATELVSGDSEPAPLDTVLARVRVPTLLIASGRGGERTIDAAYRDRIGARAALWFVPDAGHTEALTKHPEAYAARVTTFLAAALRDPSPMRSTETR